MSQPDLPTSAFSVGVCRAAPALPVRPLDALRRRMKSSGGRTDSIHTATPDKTKLPRLPVDRRRRDAARPPTRSDVVRHAKYKHAVDCCIRLNLNFFTKRHATRVIYRLTAQTLPDGLETRFTPPDTTQTALSCRVRRAV